MTTSDQQGLEEQERQQREEAAAYADAMIRRDKEKPQWLRDLNTGAREDNGFQGGY